MFIAPNELVDGSQKKEVSECTFRSMKGDLNVHPCSVIWKEKSLESR